jgi:four helix bundle protein
MATIKRFEDILSWQKARELNKFIGDIIDKGKFKRSYKLIDQIEGSSGSIMDNIAEGFERGGNKEFIQFLYISKGSCGEFRSQLYRAWTGIILRKLSLIGFIILQKKLSCYFKN